MKYYIIKGSDIIYEGKVDSATHKIDTFYKKINGRWEVFPATDLNIELKVATAYKQKTLKSFLTLDLAKKAIS